MKSWASWSNDRGGEVCHGNFDRVAVSLREDFGMDADTATHLRNNYGTRGLQLALLAQSDAHSSSNKGRRFYNKLHPKYPLLEAEVTYACRHEYAQTAVDVIARRTRISFLDANAALEVLPRVVSLMAKELKWSRSRAKQEEKDAISFLETMKYTPES